MKQHSQQYSKIKTWFANVHARLSLGTVIMVAFTLTAVVASTLMGVSYYTRFSQQLSSSLQKENEYILQQANDNLMMFTRSLMRVSDSLRFNVIKDNDFSKENISDELNLLYNTNKDIISNITLFSQNGGVLQSAPAAVPKGNSRVKSQDWFVAAQNGEENQHFSMPHVQNLFVNSDYRYNWVVSLSQVVEMSYDNEVEQGVLLLDVKYSALEDMLSGIRLGKNGYIYLTNDAGQIVYHPNAQLLWSGQMDEKPFDIEGKKDGIYETKINGDKYDLLVKTTGYTGWRLVGVVPRNNAELSNFKSIMFLVFLFVLFFTVLLAINLFISNKITDPILKLEKAVKKLAEGDLDVPIPASGFFEIWHLENSIRKMVSQLRHLMDDIVRSQQSLRKNELDVLQSQINPHFLYNTLDIIVWMIENEQRDDAVQAVTALARFFRISLSKGKAIISVSDEIEHVNNYLLIQKMRYKNKFEYIIDCDEQAKSLTTVKLILQPIVENAIYHAIEFMDGDGEIKISAHIVDSTLVFCVEDNGAGMTKETAHRLENGEIQPSKRGSGIGVCNVAQRIKLVYGDEYGLSVESEPDCGTKVFIKIPVDGGGANNEYE